MHCELWFLALPLPFLLASSVLRNALSHIEIGAYFTSTSNSAGELHPILLHISKLYGNEE